MQAVRLGSRRNGTIPVPEPGPEVPLALAVAGPGGLRVLTSAGQNCAIDVWMESKTELEQVVQRLSDDWDQSFLLRGEKQARGSDDGDAEGCSESASLQVVDEKPRGFDLESEADGFGFPVTNGGLPHAGRNRPAERSDLNPGLEVYADRFLSDSLRDEHYAEEAAQHAENRDLVQGNERRVSATTSITESWRCRSHLRVRLGSSG
jgi:hypothetical protein